MPSEDEHELKPNETLSPSRKTGHEERATGRGQAQRVPHFEGRPEELKGWCFDSTDSRGADKFDAVGEEITRYISVKFNYGTELKSSIDKLEAITINKPTAVDSKAEHIEKDIYKEEIREYVKAKKALERATKQAYSLVWGQCSRPMREKLRTVDNFETFSAEENVRELLKVRKSTILKFDNKCDTYVAVGNITSQFWRFFQSRDMSNLVDLKSLKPD
mmetsp:Transcript_20898/g.30720  ORF Transcript_20898/g.30720 Transcript_20898/m.30720 type:complete len:218 (-) Transcript_20898:420-1073(-)